MCGHFHMAFVDLVVLVAVNCRFCDDGIRVHKNAKLFSMLCVYVYVCDRSFQIFKGN